MPSRNVDSASQVLDRALGVVEVKEWAPLQPSGLWVVEVLLESGQSIRASAKTVERARKRLHLKLRGDQSSAACG